MDTTTTVEQPQGPAPVFKTLTCQTCNKTWQRVSQRGRQPLECPECAAAPKAAKPKVERPKVEKPAPEPIDFSQFASDEEALLSLVPKDGAANNNKLRERLGWDEAKYNTVKNSLFEQKKLSKCAAGPGGGVRHWHEGDEVSVTEEKPEEPPMDFSLFATDEEAFLSLVPAEGSVNNRYLLRRLGWDQDKFDRVKNGLLAAGQIKKSAGGAGGSVRLFQPGDEIDTEEEEKLQTLTCGNTSCESPQWTRPSKGGRTPKYCPTCREAVEGKASEEEETTESTPKAPVSHDAKVFSATDEATATKVIEGLKEIYPRTEFYVKEEAGDLTVMIRRKFAVAISPDILENVQSAAFAIANPEPPEPLAAEA